MSTPFDAPDWRGTMKPLSLVAGIAAANHFTVMNEMVSPTGRITTLIRQLFERGG